MTIQNDIRSVTYDGHVISQHVHNNHISISNNGRIVFRTEETAPRNKAGLIDIYRHYRKVSKIIKDLEVI